MSVHVIWTSLGNMFSFGSSKGGSSRDSNNILHTSFFFYVWWPYVVARAEYAISWLLAGTVGRFAYIVGHSACFQIVFQMMRSLYSNCSFGIQTIIFEMGPLQGNIMDV